MMMGVLRRNLLTAIDLMGGVLIAKEIGDYLILKRKDGGQNEKIYREI